jgi:hypothetical protein
VSFDHPEWTAYLIALAILGLMVLSFIPEKRKGRR